MSDKHEEDRLDRIISEAVDLGRVEFDRATWLARLAAKKSQTKPEPHKNLWRTIMKSPITRYSVAATILVAASVVLIGPLGSRHSVALADVAQKLSETRTLMHKERRLAWRPGEDKPFFQAEVRKYFSSEVGMVEEQYDPNGALLHRISLLKGSQEAFLLLPPLKKYIKLPVPDSIYDRFVKMIVPSGLVEYFLSQPYTRLGRSHFGEFEVEEFEATHFDLSWTPWYMEYLFPIRDLTARLQIDVQTSLPVGVKMVMDADRGLMNGFRKVHAEFTAYDFEWNAELPEGVFDTSVPADYTEIDLGSVAAENAAWLGVGGVPLGFLAYRGCRKRRWRTGASKTTVAR